MFFFGPVLRFISHFLPLTSSHISLFFSVVTPPLCSPSPKSRVLGRRFKVSHHPVFFHSHCAPLNSTSLPLFLVCSTPPPLSAFVGGAPLFLSFSSLQSFIIWCLWLSPPPHFHSHDIRRSKAPFERFLPPPSNISQARV